MLIVEEFALCAGIGKLGWGGAHNVMENLHKQRCISVEPAGQS